jgi:hypothetical protein
VVYLFYLKFTLLVYRFTSIGCSNFEHQKKHKKYLSFLLMHQEEQFKLTFSKIERKKCLRKPPTILISKSWKNFQKLHTKLWKRILSFQCSNPPCYTNSYCCYNLNITFFQKLTKKCLAIVRCFSTIWSKKCLMATKHSLGCDVEKCLAVCFMLSIYFIVSRYVRLDFTNDFLKMFFLHEI